MMNRLQFFLKELEKKNEREFLDETAYTFFEMSEREIELRADTKNNKIIEDVIIRRDSIESLKSIFD